MARAVTALIFAALCAAGFSAHADVSVGTESQLLRALHLVEQRRLEEAKTALESLCPFAKDEMLRRGRGGDIACLARKNVILEYRQLAEPESLGDTYWLAGEQAREAKQYNVAYALLRISLDRKPGEASTWLSLAHVYRETEQLAKAEEALHRSLELEPDDPYVMYWLATVKMNRGQLPEAEEQLMRVLEIDPSHARVWFRLGEIRLLQERPKAALELFEKAKAQGVQTKQVREKIKECRRELKRLEASK